MEEEDSHYCLRCRTTIQGLENYIQHRREKCISVSKNETSNHHSYLIAPRNVGTTNSLLGRASYQQMGLTSTPSKGSRSIDPVLSSSSNHMEAERFKPRDNSSTDHHQNPLADLSVEISADDFMNHLGLCMVSSANWATELGHPEEPLRADDFFSLLELQSCSRVPPATTGSRNQRQRRSNELVSPTGEDRFKTSLGDEHQSSSFSLNESADLNTTRDSNASAIDFPISVGANGSGEDLTDNGLALLTTHPSSSAVSSPNHCPVSVAIALEPNVEVVLDERPSEPQPFPSRGKWMPGLKPRDIHKSGSSVEYHCKCCNRRLTGRAVFEKHLQSELHFKRSAAYEQNNGSDEPTAAKFGNYGLRTTRKKRKMDGDDPVAVGQPQKAEATRKQVEAVVVDTLQDDADMWWLQPKETNESNRRCPICCVWVPNLMFGRHLVSRFHYTRSQANAVQRDRCILDNIGIIVMEAPFQCRLCRFYCHSHDNLLVHWRSPLHLQNDANAPSTASYFCSLCRENCSSCNEMGKHIESPKHLNCVEIVNKSVAAIISRPIFLDCHMCESSFRYRIQLNKHLKTLHALSAANLKAHPSTPVFACTHCSFRNSSKAAYTHHIFNCKRVPKEELKYRCLICDRTFNSRDEVIRHRSTQEHRDASKSQRSVDGGGGKLRTCQHCYQSFPNLPALKEHLLSNHVNLLPRCPNCLTMFALKQELSAHRRAGCQVPTGSTAVAASTAVDRVEDALMSCDVCSYVCRTRYDLLYHQAVEHRTGGECDGGISEGKYRCPDCGHDYCSTASLKAHLRSHEDSAFRCGHCSRFFFRREDRDAHIRQLHLKIRRGNSNQPSSSSSPSSADDS